MPAVGKRGRMRVDMWVEMKRVKKGMGLINYELIESYIV